jgi:hypothetical protein
VVFHSTQFISTSARLRVATRSVHKSHGTDHSQSDTGTSCLNGDVSATLVASMVIDWAGCASAPSSSNVGAAQSVRSMMRCK